MYCRVQSERALDLLNADRYCTLCTIGYVLYCSVQMAKVYEIKDCKDAAGHYYHSEHNALR